MTFINMNDLPTYSPMQGGQARFVHTEHMTMAHWNFEAGTALPQHSHPHEQITALIEGEFEFTLDGHTEILRPGSVVLIPPNAPHSGRSITASYLVDVFYPVREDFRALP